MILTPLTTNDVRVLRTLFDDGPATAAALRDRLARQMMGEAAGMRRVPSLVARRFATVDSRTRALCVTDQGAHALRAADRAAYGRWAD